MAKIRTEILIESSDSLIIKRKRYSARAFCAGCRRAAIMVLPTEAAFLSGQNINSIIFLTIAGALHFRRLGEGRLFICLTSLCLFSFESGGGEEFPEIVSGIEKSGFNFINEEIFTNET